MSEGRTGFGARAEVESAGRGEGECLRLGGGDGLDGAETGAGLNRGGGELGIGDVERAVVDEIEGLRQQQKLGNLEA